MRDTPPSAPAFDGTQPCREDPAVFFPARIDSPTALAAARAICNRCPFQTECAEYGITEHSIGGRWLDGIWAGLSERQRQRIREKRAAA